MRTFILPFVIVLAVSACQYPKKKTVTAKPPFKMALVIGDPVSYGEENLLVFPIGANYNPEIKEKTENRYSTNNGSDEDKVEVLTKDRSVGSFKRNDQKAYMFDVSAELEFSNSNMEDFDMRNILFYDKKSGGSYILSNDTLHILSFSIHREFSKPLIFYRVVKRDINADKKYDSEDAVMLYVSDTKGQNLVQVTPENEQFFEYFYYPETQSILIKSALDIDNDKRFTKLDETVFREMRLDSPSFGKEIFPSSLKQTLKNQISILQ